MSLSVLILGTDAIAAVAPNTAAQLIHACQRLGFAAVVPVSWGEELIAREVIDACAARVVPRIQCSCPRVRERLGASASLISDALIVIDPPAVTTARFLRKRSGGETLHVTYAGGCPIGPSPEIDEQVPPEELLSAFARSGIDISTEPGIFEDMIPPDMRRFHSQPGGLPDPQRLWEASRFLLTAPHANDVAVNIAQALLDGGGVLIDITDAAGCACRTNDSHDSTTARRADRPILPDERLNIQS